MRIKFLQSVAATAWAYLPGEVHEVPDDQAAQYITNQVAVRMVEIEASEAVGQSGAPRPPRQPARGGVNA